MTGIPSIGDILMLSQLAWKIGRAFTAGRKGAPAEFLEVESEVNGLAKALKLLAETLFADADDGLLKHADKETQNGVAIVLTSCQRTVHDLDSLMDQYQVIQKHRTVGGFAIERSWSDLVLTQYKTMMWTTEGGNIGNLRNMLQVHTRTITITMQALQSKSSARLESVVKPMAQKIDHLYHKTGSLEEQLEETQRTILEIARTTPKLAPTVDVDSRSLSTLDLDLSQQANPAPETFSIRDHLPPRTRSKNSPRPQSPQSNSPPPRSPDFTITEASSSPTTSRATSPTSRKRVSEMSFSEASSRYSSSYASSDASTSVGWPSPAPTRSSFGGRQPSMRREIALAMTPELREPNSRPDSAVLSSLPPPVMDVPDDVAIEVASSLAKLSIHPPTQPEILKLHRSATTSSQKDLFEKQAFRNSAVLCDVRGVLVEYAHRVSSEEDSHDVEMIEACKDCRIAVIRKREPAFDNKSVHMMTSIWVFSDDNAVRLQLKMGDGEMYIPYSSYFTPEKVSITVACELKYHDVRFGSRPIKTARTTWINYVFEDVKGATLFQNELMGRSLLATFQTSKTLRLHEGFSGAFAYAEQMCAMENLRIWEDDETGAVIALIHFSPQFRNGYFSFYLNSSGTPVRVKDEGGREVKIKGLRVPMEKASAKDSRKDSGVGKDFDKRKFITGAKIEFESEAEKREFINLVKDVQRTMFELPDLMGVN